MIFFEPTSEPMLSISSYRETLLQMITLTENELICAPPGTLYIKKSNGKVEYYHRLPGSKSRRIYIPKSQIELAMLLAQKDYNRKLLVFLNETLNSLNRFSADFTTGTAVSLPYQALDNIYYSLSAERQALVTPIIPDTRKFVADWLSEPYEKKPFRPDDHTAFYTRKDERMRSKSELYIAGVIDQMMIPRKYECPLHLDDLTLYPDFTLLDLSTRSVKYLEHCGMMDDPDYVNRFIWKVNFYQAHGIIPGKSLILTFESAARPLDTRTLDYILPHYFPRMIHSDGSDPLHLPLLSQ